MIIRHEVRDAHLAPGLPSADNAVVQFQASEEQRAAPNLPFNIPIPHDELFLEFAKARLFQGPDSHDIDIWPSHVERKLADASGLALATTFFGAEHGDSSVVKKGLHRYSRVLEQVNRALGDAEQRLSFDVLEAVVTMSLFEVNASSPQI
jgi:hypothetical protein